MTGHEFYSVTGPGIKVWNTAFAPVPENYHLIGTQLPPGFDFDVVFSQNKEGQYPLLRQVARELHLPLVSLEHCLPPTGMSQLAIQKARTTEADVSVFISNVSRDAWLEPDGIVIEHGVDTGLFSPDWGKERTAVALSAVNQWKDRDWCCGYNLWRHTAEGIPTRVVGDNPGWTEPLGPEGLREAYQDSLIFLNTSLVSPVPTVLLEAMACGCAIVSTATCMIPDIITHGVNGLLGNTPDQLRDHVKSLIANPDRARKLGEAARQTIVDRFNMARFVSEWDSVFRHVAGMVKTFDYE